MEYTVEEVDRFGDALTALPDIDPAKRKLDKQAAVKRLKEKIALAQQRGYTLEEIAECLTSAGLQLTTPTLKSYLQRAKKASSKGAAKAPRRSSSAATREPTSAEKAKAEKAPPLVPKAAPEAPAESTPKSTRSEFIATDRVRL